MEAEFNYLKFRQEIFARKQKETQSYSSRWSKREYESRMQHLADAEDALWREQREHDETLPSWCPHYDKTFWTKEVTDADRNASVVFQHSLGISKGFTQAIIIVQNARKKLEIQWLNNDATMEEIQEAAIWDDGQHHY